MMEMANGFVQYGSFLTPLCTAPPMDGQSTNQETSGKSSKKKKSKPRRVNISASTKDASLVAEQTSPTFKVGVGSSFLKMFVGNIANTMFLPRGYIIESEFLEEHWFTIRGPSKKTYRVWVESYLDSLVLRDGWSDLVVGEAIGQGDIGLFNRVGAMEFSLTVYGRGGLEKEAAAPTAAIPNNMEEPKWEDVQFITSTGIRRTAALVSTLFSVWVRATHPIILYATTIKQSAIKGGPMNLNRRVSTRLPAGPTPIGLKFNGSRIVFPGSIVKRGDQLARIQGGWSDFAQAHKLVVGKAYVFKFSIDHQGWEATVYQV